MIIEFAGSTAPDGFLLCPTSPQNISRTTYSRLFAAIGTKWGAGDGTTTFGIPWFPADYAAIQAENGNVGTQSAGEVISHNHIAGNNNGPSSSDGQGASAVGRGNSNYLTSATGGSANLAAGVRVLRCVKY